MTKKKAQQKKQKMPQTARIPDAMTTKELLFIEAWLEHGCNGVLAYQEIDPTATRRHASSQAMRILRRPHVQEYVLSIMEAVHTSANEIMARLSVNIRARYSHFINEKGDFDIEKARALGMDGALKSVTYLFDGDGKRIGVQKLELQNVVDTAALLLKIHGTIKEEVVAVVERRTIVESEKP